ncbi:MAG: M20 family metallo-hydrolase [Spirochaetales bacterium]|nr:M20 family metallo-hydrolase [Spirochaetales bacterium]MCF7939185.1 M20 family metallo-hydrolase [Spirochaetales bacterium]
MQEQESTQATAKAIDMMREELIDLQRKLTAVPALGPQSDGAGETEKASVLEQWLVEHGFSVRHFDAPDSRVPSGIRPNLLVEIDPPESEAPVAGTSAEHRLWIMSHLDVVPPGEQSLWESDPYTLRVEGDRIYGRGVEDNQQGLVASIGAALALKQAGVCPSLPVRLLFVADEETGSTYGIQYLLKEHPDLFSEGDLFLVPDSGTPAGDEIEIAEKSTLWLKLKTRGKQCHASMPQEGKNAFVAASELVLRLSGMNKRFPQTNSLFQPSASTFAPTKKEANVPNVNTIPGEDVFYLDARILPEIPVDDVLEAVREEANRVEDEYGVAVEVETVQRVSSPPTPGDSILVEAVGSALKRVRGVEGRSIGIGGGTVGAYLRLSGYDTVVWGTLEETMHMPNEYCLVPNLLNDAKVMADMMIQNYRS